MPDLNTFDRLEAYIRKFEDRHGPVPVAEPLHSSSSSLAVVRPASDSTKRERRALRELQCPKENGMLIQRVQIDPPTKSVASCTSVSSAVSAALADYRKGLELSAVKRQPLHVFGGSEPVCPSREYIAPAKIILESREENGVFAASSCVSLSSSSSDEPLGLSCSIHQDLLTAEVGVAGTLKDAVSRRSTARYPPRYAGSMVGEDEILLELQDQPHTPSSSRPLDLHDLPREPTSARKRSDVAGLLPEAIEVRRSVSPQSFDFEPNDPGHAIQIRKESTSALLGGVSSTTSGVATRSPVQLATGDGLVKLQEPAKLPSTCVPHRERNENLAVTIGSAYGPQAQKTERQGSLKAAPVQAFGISPKPMEPLRRPQRPRSPPDFHKVSDARRAPNSICRHDQPDMSKNVASARYPTSPSTSSESSQRVHEPLPASRVFPAGCEPRWTSRNEMEACGAAIVMCTGVSLEPSATSLGYQRSVAMERLDQDVSKIPDVHLEQTRSSLEAKGGTGITSGAGSSDTGTTFGADTVHCGMMNGSWASVAAANAAASAAVAVVAKSFHSSKEFSWQKSEVCGVSLPPVGDYCSETAQALLETDTCLISDKSEHPRIAQIFAEASSKYLLVSAQSCAESKAATTSAVSESSTTNCCTEESSPSITSGSDSIDLLATSSSGSKSGTAESCTKTSSTLVVLETGSIDSGTQSSATPQDQVASCDEVGQFQVAMKWIDAALGNGPDDLLRNTEASPAPCHEREGGRNVVINSIDSREKARNSADVDSKVVAMEDVEQTPQEQKDIEEKSKSQNLDQPTDPLDETMDSLDCSITCISQRPWKSEVRAAVLRQIPEEQDLDETVPGHIVKGLLVHPRSICSAIEDSLSVSENPGGDVPMCAWDDQLSSKPSHAARPDYVAEMKRITGPMTTNPCPQDQFSLQSDTIADLPTSVRPSTPTLSNFGDILQRESEQLPAKSPGPLQSKPEGLNLCSIMDGARAFSADAEEFRSIVGRRVEDLAVTQRCFDMCQMAVRHSDVLRDLQERRKKECI